MSETGHLIVALRFGTGPRMGAAFIIVELTDLAAVRASRRRLLRANE